MKQFAIRNVHSGGRITAIPTNDSNKFDFRALNHDYTPIRKFVIKKIVELEERARKTREKPRQIMAPLKLSLSPKREAELPYNNALALKIKRQRSESYGATNNQGPACLIPDNQKIIKKSATNTGASTCKNPITVSKCSEASTMDTIHAKQSRIC